MDILSGDIALLVFKRMVQSNMGDVSLDSRMLEVLMELDGKKNLGSIAKITGMNTGTLREAVSKLLKLNLVENVEVKGTFLDNEFMGYLNEQLALAIGPVAEVIIEDAVSDLGCKMSQIPSHKSAELIDLLSREIQRNEKKEAFKLNMVKRIKEKGY
ncbi:MAG: hypothetical protein EHM85_06100 [Desulfobacteraceae bacterium]|nr:MAG: hypothetical protein EHM85_06100 [Desulfobacteraceae bacterium]